MLVHWIWLATRPNMNERDKLAVLTHFQDPEDAYFADMADYAGIEGLTKDALESLCDKDLEPAKEIIQTSEQKKLQLLTYGDRRYPYRLKNIVDPPLVLYYKGELPDFDSSPVIGVVGTRKASVYGMSVAKRMGYQIGKCGGIVVSGAASGIDTAAMQGALTAGQTAVGVLGCGADLIYPASNRGLFADVARHGCLISEFPPGTPPYKWNFPKRNRIISGMSNGVLVVEAPVKSGALITARQAADQGRDVFVVPGNIDVASCAGSNALLRDGALAVSSGWDVVSEYQGLYPNQVHKDLSTVEQPGEKLAKVAQMTAVPENMGPLRQESDKKGIDKKDLPPYSDGNDYHPALSETEQRLLSLLGSGERLVDEIIAETGLPAGTVLAALTMLQVKGFVTALPGRRVIRNTI